MKKWTWFCDEEGNRLGSDEGILPILLYKGMKITMHGHPDKEFKVMEWYYHHGQPDEESGLRIILRDMSDFAGIGFA
jgi:hypothetical protein